MFGIVWLFKVSLFLDIFEWYVLRKYFFVCVYFINIVLLCICMWIKFSVSYFVVIVIEMIVVLIGYLVGFG